MTSHTSRLVEGSLRLFHTAQVTSQTTLKSIVFDKLSDPQKAAITAAVQAQLNADYVRSRYWKVADTLTTLNVAVHVSTLKDTNMDCAGGSFISAVGATATACEGAPAAPSLRIISCCTNWGSLNREHGAMAPLRTPCPA